MSTDINIKPVGMLVAPPSIPSSDAARNGVATQLPPSQTVTPLESAARPRITPEQTTTSRSNKVVIDKAAAAIVYQTIDDRTSEIIGQFPAEGVLKQRAYIRAEEEVREASLSTAYDRRA